MGKKVLIVDDDQAALEVYTAFFRSKGYEVLGAPGGKKAIDILSKEKIDLMILDLAMPEMEGEDVMERMVANEEWKKIPIIIDSALGPDTGRPAKVRTRFDGKLRFSFFQRPSSLDDISTAIQQILAL